MGGAEPVERAAELEQLSALLAAAANGRGQLCVIQGASGIGKSRLLEECASLASSSGMTVIRARCSELASEYTFGVVRHLFEANVVRAEPVDRAVLLQGPAALAAPVFGDGEAADEFSVMHGLYWLTVNLAEQRPMTILVDDLTWADECSLRFLVYLAERLDDLPVALIVTVRSGDPVCRVAAGQSPMGVGNIADNPTWLRSPRTVSRRYFATRFPGTAVSAVACPDRAGPDRRKPVPRRGRRGRHPCRRRPLRDDAGVGPSPHQPVAWPVLIKPPALSRTPRSVLGDDAALRDVVQRGRARAGTTARSRPESSSAGSCSRRPTQ